MSSRIQIRVRRPQRQEKEKGGVRVKIDALRRNEKEKVKGKGKGHHNTKEYYECWTPEDYWWPEYDDWSYEGKGYSEDGGEEGEGEPEAEGGDFCILSINSFNSSEVSTDEGNQYVRMVMDSKTVGRGFPITQDEHSGFEYLGAGGEKIIDEGARTLQFVDENWTSKNLNHRVAKMRNPLVAASQTVGAGNLILMSETS